MAYEGIEAESADLINYAALNDVGQVQTTITGPADTVIGGIGYVGTSVLVTADANEDTDSFINGFRVSFDGALRVNDGTGDQFKDGVAITDDGLLCVTTGAVGTNYINGMAVTDTGRVHVSAIT